ncbi:MAG: glucose-1-phosphate thymidylyltransferase RfbA [Hyphomicrobiales bacterium]|nr:glucose-1-phosphate thymidylyltransferase RfbA [Rickettsiales bacterium]MCP5361100.1 glucose-1-phosphate thymidylyltransferase RfbA [Hyphomicrobiales bacterium]
MKGIVLAGGSGTRLYPLTASICKQLLPIYDKPMLYYPIATLMRMGIREIMIISTPRDLPMMEALLGSGERLGVSFTYKVQEAPRGIAEAFILAEDFIGNGSVCLILGDNIFYGTGLHEKLQKGIKNLKGATVLAYHVHDPERYGVVAFDKEYTAVSIEEKPARPKSNWAVTGLYFYDNQVVNIAKNLKPSARGELEITDVNRVYLKQNQLRVEIMGRGAAWLDTGTPGSLLQAAEFIETLESRQGLKVACLEEIAYRMEYITKKDLLALAREFGPEGKNGYGDYLYQVAREKLGEWLI